MLDLKLHNKITVSWLKGSKGRHWGDTSEAKRRQSADLLDGDGPAATNAVYFALSSLLLPVQVSTFSRLEEKRKGVLRGLGPFGANSPPAVPHPPLLLPLLGSPSTGSGLGGGSGRNRDTVFQWVYSYTRHHTEQHRSLSRARPPTKSKDMKYVGRDEYATQGLECK